jgi:4-hydroxy-tetrahydrodipicolinate synthase
LTTCVVPVSAVVPDFTILSGDDGMTFEMMTDPLVKGAGVISVVSNVAPQAVSQMVSLLKDKNESEARTLMEALTPLFGLVTIKTQEQTPYGEVTCKARNPIGIKLLMTILGMPSGGCRQPLRQSNPKWFEQGNWCSTNSLEKYPGNFTSGPRLF